jgi:hypothetical protein
VGALVRKKRLNCFLVEFMFSLIIQCLTLASLRIIWRTNLMLEQLAVVALISFFLSHFFRKKLGLFVENRYRTLVTLLLVFNLLAFTVGNVQRSTSLYLLSWVGDHKPSGVTLSVLENKLIKRDQSVDYVGLKQRVNEHEKRHLFLIQNDGRIVLTLEGKFVLAVAKFLSHVFNLDLWKERISFSRFK